MIILKAFCNTVTIQSPEASVNSSQSVSRAGTANTKRAAERGGGSAQVSPDKVDPWQKVTYSFQLFGGQF